MDPLAVTERTERFLGIPAVVGFEGPFLAALASEVRALGRDAERRSGLLAVAGGPTTVSAHIDRHGFVVGEDSRLRYAANVAAHRALSPRLAATICRRFDRERVVAYDPSTGDIVGEGTVGHEEHCGIADVELFAEGLCEVEAGTPVAFAPGSGADGPWLRGQLDNPLSAALCMELVADGFDGTVLFTAGEEAGRSWEAIAGWFDQPTDTLLVLDTSPFDEPGPVESGAVVLRHRDAGAEFAPATTERVAAAASRAAAPIVWKDEVLAAAAKPLGRTELGRVVAETGGRVTGTTLQVPTTDYHTNREATAAPAIAAACRTLVELLL